MSLHPPGMTEQVQPLADVVEPGAYLPEPFVGQRVEIEGRWIADDFVVVSSRFNDGVEGFWVTGQLRIDDAVAPASIAVGLTHDVFDAAPLPAGPFEIRLAGSGS